MKETPKIVSGRVVKTSMLSVEFSMAKVTLAPWDFPIQLRCCSLMESDQSMRSNPSNNRSAYALMRIDH